VPGARAVHGVMPTLVRLPGMLGTAATRAAGDDTTDRAELHESARSGAGTLAARLTLVTLDCTSFDIAMSVNGGVGGVYSPRVLSPRHDLGNSGRGYTWSVAGGAFALDCCEDLIPCRSTPVNRIVWVRWSCQARCSRPSSTSQGFDAV
jgi:hypothetical protein